ncbi:MAG: hypothetical protein Greene041619_467 [Candidatus Peregrinibacteria bacterium Greene0416_19]|nr:MAG: hypothetical protein Greene041619_467 [Candidatus Peregrinibacteria bacterium Greene0416_19]
MIMRHSPSLAPIRRRRASRLLCSSMLTIILSLTVHIRLAAAAEPSNYVDFVLNRSRAARTYTTGSSFPPTPAAGFDRLHWQRNVVAAIAAQTDVTRQIVAQGRSLTDNSACLRTDLFLLEGEMKRVADAMTRAVDARKVASVNLLSQLLQFLNERYKILLQGARDPTSIDSSWNVRRPFDDPRFVLDPLVSFCAFDSNYLPPGLSGYGCDLDGLNRAMSRIRTHPDGQWLRDAISQQRAGIISAIIAAGRYQSYTAQFDRAMQSMPFQTNGTLQTPVPPDVTRKHRRRTMCILDGACTGDAMTPCNSDAVCSRLQIGRCVASSEVGTCSNDFNITCGADADCGGQNVCQKLEGALAYELRGPFSLERDEERLLRQYVDLRRSFGARGTAPRSFQLDGSWLYRLMGGQAATGVREFETQQAQKESMTIAAGTDPSLVGRAAFSNLSQAVGRLVTVGTTLGQPGGERTLRGFVRDFAYFLRRSCIFRPCNKRLEQVMRIITTDECFPYAKGTFVSDTDPANPRWQKCKAGAGIR